MTWSFEAMVRTSNEFMLSVLEKQEQEREAALNEEPDAVH
jgi:hypothetical protein